MTKKKYIFGNIVKTEEKLKIEKAAQSQWSGKAGRTGEKLRKSWSEDKVRKLCRSIIAIAFKVL